MGRRKAEEEGEVGEVGWEVLAGLTEVGKAFEAVGYPNAALEALARLAMVEYRGAERALDRAKWFSSLLQVAKVCGRIAEGDEDEVVVEVGESPEGKGSREGVGPAIVAMSMQGWED